MASDGTKGPKPYHRVQASTVFLRVPLRDWPLVRRGYKREFRSSFGRNKVPQLHHVKVPTPVVAYTVSTRGKYDKALMVMEAIWTEPLGAISPDSLRNEGFASLAEFRRYWIARENRRFLPTRQVFVYQVRPWAAGDEALMGRSLLDQLYGDFLPVAA